jgi:hypothetical protein
MKIRAAMIGMMGPMALLLVTLTAIAKASSGGSTSERAADGSKHRTDGSSSTATGSHRSMLLDHLWTSRSSSSHPKAG